MPKQINIGSKYWIDNTTRYKDSDGEEFVEVYEDERKRNFVGILNVNHFEPIYRYLNYGASLSGYVNSNIGFLLKDIIEWCLNHPNDSLAENLIRYIADNKLYTQENLEKEFVVNSTPFREFVEKGITDEYMKYTGYSMYCTDC